MVTLITAYSCGVLAATAVAGAAWFGYSVWERVYYPGMGVH